MQRVQNLQNLIICVEELLAKRIHVEEECEVQAFEQQLMKASQKISLAENRFNVKNTRSDESSEEQ